MRVSERLLERPTTDKNREKEVLLSHNQIRLRFDADRERLLYVKQSKEVAPDNKAAKVDWDAIQYADGQLTRSRNFQSHSSRKIRTIEKAFDVLPIEDYRVRPLFLRAVSIGESANEFRELATHASNAISKEIRFVGDDVQLRWDVGFHTLGKGHFTRNLMKMDADTFRVKDASISTTSNDGNTFSPIWRLTAIGPKTGMPELLTVEEMFAKLASRDPAKWDFYFRTLEREHHWATTKKFPLDNMPVSRLTDEAFLKRFLAGE
ncbi:MAG: hypothetical protein AAF958_05015 [Planctomycetota bacterium]